MKFPLWRVLWFPLAVYLPNLFVLLYGRQIFGFEAYVQYPWIDIPMHFIGGLSIAYGLAIIIQFLENRGRIRIFSRWLLIALIVAGTVCAALAWEYEEFLSDRFFGTHQQLSTADTMKDFLNGLLGGAVGGWLFTRQKKE